MTKHDLLAQVRQTAPGEYTDERVMELAENCNQRMLKEILGGYIVPETDEELVAPPPYDQIYYWWVMANIALDQRNVNAYNNYMTMYNTLWDEYGRMISRTYLRNTVYYYKL